MRASLSLTVRLHLVRAAADGKRESTRGRRFFDLRRRAVRDAYRRRRAREVQTFEDLGKLRRLDRDARVARPHRTRQTKYAALQSLAEHAVTRAIPPEGFEPIARPVDEEKESATARVMPERLFGRRRQPLKRASHIDRPGRAID